MGAKVCMKVLIACEHSGIVRNVDKLKQKDIKPLREQMYVDQVGCCTICGQEIYPGEEVLDHDHASGHVRSVLHRDCNVLLGKIENFLSTRATNLKKHDAQAEFFNTVMWYMTQDWSFNPLHPKHKTEKEKQITIYRRKIKQVKKEETKEKYRKLIKELQDEETIS